jgi:hypothetical protein
LENKNYLEVKFDENTHTYDAEIYKLAVQYKREHSSLWLKEKIDKIMKII